MAEEEQVAEAPADAGQAPSVEAATTETTESDWRDGLPDDVKGHQSLETIPNVGALAKSYVHAQSMIGSDKIPVPGKWATDDDWNVVYEKLGRPADASGYEISAKDGENPDMVDWFKETAHGIGLNSTQAEKLLSSYSEMVSSRTETSEKEIEQQRTDTDLELKREWGRAYDQRMQLAHNVLMNFGDEELTELQTADGTKFGDHPAIVRMFADVGKWIQEKVGEDSIAGPKQTGAMAPDEANAKLAEIKAPGSPFWDGKHPQHDHFVEEALKYQEMLAPE